MLIDITLPITPAMLEDAIQNPNPALKGHLGTHFDAMGKEFPLAYTRREGIAFDVSALGEGEIGIKDIDLGALQPGMFAAFYTGYIEKVPYHAPGYFAHHPVLSMALLEALVEKGVSVIGLDCGGVRRGKEHTPADQYCADRGTFIIENLVGLQQLVGKRFTAHIYPMPLSGLTGLPCRVLAEISKAGSHREE